MNHYDHDVFPVLTLDSIRCLSSSRDGRWSEVMASAMPSLLRTARQSPALEIIRLPFLIRAVTQHDPPR